MPGLEWAGGGYILGWGLLGTSGVECKLYPGVQVGFGKKQGEVDLLGGTCEDRGRGSRDRAWSRTCVGPWYIRQLLPQ